MWVVAKNEMGTSSPPRTARRVFIFTFRCCKGCDKALSPKIRHQNRAGCGAPAVFSAFQLLHMHRAVDRLQPVLRAMSHSAPLALYKYSTCEISDALIKLGLPHGGHIPDIHMLSPAPSGSDTPNGLHIPAGRDGFFGYQDERTLHQVRHEILPVWTHSSQSVRLRRRSTRIDEART